MLKTTVSQNIVCQINIYKVNDEFIHRYLKSIRRTSVSKTDKKDDILGTMDRFLHRI